MILFVDDEQREMDSFYLELQMQLSANKVVFINKVDEALKFFKENIDQIQLLILDIMMPPGAEYKNVDTQQGLRTGVKFFETVRAEAPDLPIIIFTNVTEPRVADDFMKQKKCQFFRKENYAPAELAEEVLKILS
jgi:DNA-binding NtrC family response regulator